MTALVAIGWAAATVVSIILIGATWGNIMLVAMFPEGHRWWMPWSRIATLALFAVLVLLHPFGGFGK